MHYIKRDALLEALCSEKLLFYVLALATKATVGYDLPKM